jgi:hypothetical protein
MNRKERRAVSKRLGILQYQQKLPRNKKFELIKENIIAGHKQEAEFKEEVRRWQNLTQEERDNECIQALTEKMAKEKKIPVIDAFEKAQIQYYKKVKKHG